jgi:hypothetical protein
VPLYLVNANIGFPTVLSYGKLTRLIERLMRLRSLVTARGVSDIDRSVVVYESMKPVHEIIRMLYRAPAHVTGDEMPLRYYPRRRSVEIFPRECRLSNDPLAGIERITRDLIGSIDFCKGLVYRFVSRETRSDWIESLHELYALLEQVFYGHQDIVLPSSNVRLVWMHQYHELIHGTIQGIQTHLNDYLRLSEPRALDYISVLLSDFIQDGSSMRNPASYDFVGESSEMTAIEAVAEFLEAAQCITHHGYISADEARRIRHAAAYAFQQIHWERCHAVDPLHDRSADETPPLDLQVSRDNVLDHAIEWFTEHEGSEIASRRFQIQFLQEFGSDAGGLRREWYSLLARKIVESGIMIETEADSRRYLPRTIGDNVMEFVGKFVAKAVKDRETILIRFARVALRYILEGLDSVELNLETFREDYPEHATALKWMLDNESSEAIRDLNFSLDIIEGGVRRVHELIEGGSDIPVTADNKVEYVNHVIEYKMRQSIRPQLESFLLGFHSVLPRDELSNLFTSVDELDLRIAGSPVIDISDLRAHTRYSGYIEEEIQITWFWDVIESFTQEELSLLVKFTSGTPAAPVGGFANLPLRIARVGLNVDPARNPLPSAHTCFNQLDLPEYTSKEELREKLILSITRGNEGFGFA